MGTHTGQENLKWLTFTIFWGLCILVSLVLFFVFVFEITGSESVDDLLDELKTTPPTERPPPPGMKIIKYVLTNGGPPKWWLAFI